jgi:membrane peptidoglycan carboxypeptidase
VVTTAQALGISAAEVPHSTFDTIPSVVIGAAAVKPIEMAGAYAAVADGGVFHQPSCIDTISDRTGNVIYQGLDPGHRVFSTQIAAEADVALRAVVTGGTGTAASIYNRPVAGKTGTTNNNVDAWFNGFTPQLETTVWMGNLQGEVPMTDVGGVAVYGAGYPARTWYDYSTRVLADDPVEQLPAVDYTQIPPTKYVTSPGLVHDDLSDHNGGDYNYNGNGYNGGSGPTGSTPTTTYSPPATTPPTSRPRKSPPTSATTSPPKTTPNGAGGGHP